MNHSRWRNTETLFFIFAFIFLNAMFVFAGPSRTTYQAKIVKPDGYPLEATSVNFKFTILDPAGSCILYSETYSSVNMAATGGLISFALGSGVKTYPASATTFEQVFSNITPSLTCDAGGPGNYTPSANDNRKIVMQFHDGNGWQTLPAMSINAVPYAMYANDAQNLDGKAASDFVQVSTLVSCGASEALRYNGATFSCVAVDTGAGVTSGSVTTALGYTPADGASVTALSSSLATTNSNVSAVSSSVSVVASDVFAVSSTVSSLSTTVSNLTSTVSGIANTVSGLSASMAALVSSQWESNGSKIYYNSGFVGIGTSNPLSALELVSSTASMHINLQGADNSGASVRYFSKRGSQGETLGSSNPSADNKGWSVGSIGDQNAATTRRNNFEASYWNGTAWSIPFVITASGSVGIGSVIPATKLDVSGAIRIGMDTTGCASGLAGALRYNSGTVEYCNGTSWMPFGVAGAGITNINGSTSGSQTFATGTTGTAFNLSTANGIHTFNIPLAASGSVTAGLVSNADYLIFSNKLNSTSAAVASALGYTPANSATVLTTSTNFAGDVSGVYNSLVLANSGVTAGSYTKVTVDAKGRVTSGSALSSSDVVSALGYTPADNAASGTFLVKANNLSDLASATVARNNLGLGSLATLNFLDLGSSFASGTLAAARLPAFSGDATSPLGSSVLTLASVGAGVTSGTQYTKVTVDGKGRVVSGAQLSVTDVTTALGYTPASASASTQWTTSGSAIFYNTGNVGIATSAPTERLSVGGNINLINGGSNVDRYVNVATNGGNEKSFIRFDQTAVGGVGRYWDIGSITKNNVYDLGFEASGTRRMTLTFAGNLGVGTSAPVTKLDVAGGLKISMEPATCAASYAGTLRYNSGNVEYCNGSTWTAFGAATEGLTSLNGSASQTQTFANGSTGNAPAFVTANGVHTLNIPLASATGSVTAGLISNADYLTFLNKLNATSAAVIAALGYTPANNAASGTYLVKANNLSDLTSSATARTNLGLGAFATANTVDLGSASATGIIADARLANQTGVTSGTQYTKVTVDGKGRVVSGAQLSSSDVTAALGFTPAQSSSSTQWLNNGSAIYYASGNVGIGTSTTTAPLQVKATTLSAANTSQTIFKVESYPNGGAVDRLLEVAQDAGADGTNTSAVLRMGNGFTNSNLPDEVQIHTLGNSWFNGGNVGVGTSAPEALLHVVRSSGTTIGQTSSGTANAGLLIEGGGTGVLAIDGNEIQQFGDSLFLRGENGISFSAGDNADGDSTTPMVITETSRVGFGTTNPLVPNHFFRSTTMGTIGSLNLNNSVVRIQEAASASLNIDGNTIAAEDDLFIGTKGMGSFQFFSSDTVRVAISNAGNVGIGVNTPTAKLHIISGTTTVAPLKFTSGALTTAAQAGAVEYDGFNLYFTDGTNTRRTLTTGSSSGSIDNASAINSTGNITMVPGAGSVIVSSTTASTNSSTGALIVKGGMGVAGNIYSSGTIITSADIQGSDITATSSMITPYVYGSTAPGGSLRLESTTHATKGNVLLASGGGNVGVGTSTPTFTLDVSGTTNVVSFINDVSIISSTAFKMNYRAHDGYSDFGGIGLINSGTTRSDTAVFYGDDIADSLRFVNVRSASPNYNLIENMRLTADGKLGLGTNSPSYLMDLYAAANPTLRIRSASNDPASGPAIRLTEDLAENGGFVRYHSLSNSLDLGVMESAAETAVLSLNRTTGKVTMNAVSGTGLLVDLDARTTGDSELLLQADSDDNAENDNPFVHFKQDNNQIHGYLGLVGNAGDGFNFNITDSAANALVLNSTSAQLQLATSNTVRMTISQAGYTGVGVSSPTARLHVMAGSTGAAPLKMTAGTLLTTPQAGAVEYDGTDFYVTDGAGARRTIATATTAGTLDNVTVVSSTSGIALWPAAGNSVTVSATTASTNSSTGALIVKGGMGIAGNLYSSGTIITSSNIQGAEVTATSATITPYVYGSTASGGSLRLEATTHASKGNVLLAAGGGNVGIGHTAPTSILDIRKIDPVVKIKNTGGDIGGMFLMNSANTGWLGLFNPSTTSAFGIVASSTSRAFIAWDSSGKVGTVTDTFTTTPGAPAYRVILDDGNGQVGIGTTTPTYPLDVISSGTNVARFTGNHVVVNATSGNPNFSLHESGILKWALGEVSTDDRFRISNASGTEKFTILQSGNVGIGTINPEADLHVIGTARIGTDATSYMNFDVGQDITALNPGTTTTVGSVIEGGISRSLILDLKNNNVDDAFAIRYSSANNNVVDAIGFVMRGNGNVGIGTTAPSTNLDIVESINGDTTVNVRNINTGTSARSGFTLTNSGTTYGSDSAGLFLSGTGHSGGEKVSLFSNSAIASGVEIVANASTAAVMLSTQGLERMRVTNTGNVGIGTITPTGKLGIVSGGQVMNFATGGNTSGYTLNVGLNDDGINFDTPSLVRGYNFKNGNGTLAAITATGSFGIGTTTPSAVLDVQGETLGSTLNNVIEMQRWGGSLGGNGSKLDVRHIRTTAGTTWNDAGTRIQQKIDATWMGYMQFNGSGNDGGILFGTGQTTTAPGNVTERMRITQAGNVGINTTSPAYPLDVNGVINIAAASSLRFGGTIVCTSTGCTASSDRRLKEHIQPLDFSLEKLLSLNAVQYDWKDKEKFGKQHEIGFIAQDLEKVYPEVVRTDKDSGFKSVSYDKLVAPIIEALKVFNARIMKLFDRTEQNAREIASVKQENAELKARVEKTEKENEELKKRLDRIEKALTNSNTK